MHIARKRFGQNFLQDAHYIRACIDAIRPQPAETLVEIGPTDEMFDGPAHPETRAFLAGELVY